MADIDQQLEKFKKAMVKINNYQSFANSLVQRFSAYEQALEDNNIIKKRSEITGNNWSASINFIVKDYSTGTLKSLETSEFTIEDYKGIELELKNRQYQYLLLNAFEVFEQYLKSAASHIRYKYEQDEKCFSPTKFIKYLHNTAPVISRIIKIRNECNAKFLDEMNLFLTFSLIEQLRHQITHASGYANDKDFFIKMCLKRIGRDNKGKPKSEYTDYLNSFFGSKQYENLICLIEVKDNQSSFFYYDRLGELVTELASYVVFVHVHIKHLINQTKAT
jgi:hypothetical protein